MGNRFEKKRKHSNNDESSKVELISVTKKHSTVFKPIKNQIRLESQEQQQDQQQRQQQQQQHLQQQQQKEDGQQHQNQNHQHL